MVAVLVLAWRLFVAFEQGGVDALLVIFGVVVVVLGVVLGATFIYLRTLSLTVDSGGVTRRAFGLARRIPREQLQRVVVVSYTLRTRYTEREVPLVALLDARGRARLTLNLRMWAEADARALVSRLGLMERVTSLGHRERGQLAREVPGALPWTVTHRVATFFIVFGGLVALIIAIVVVVAALGGGS